MARILSIIGTRPEAIKTSVLHKLLLKNKNFELQICATGQHTGMFDDVLQFFTLEAHIRLDTINHGPDLSRMTAYLIGELDRLIKHSNPRCILVQGDTLSAWCGSMVGFLNRIPCVHIEAGLRSHNRYSPFPEEVFRRNIDHQSAILFPPTQAAARNLVNEGFDEDRIVVTGNTAIDALEFALEYIRSDAYRPEPGLQEFITRTRDNGRHPCLLTLHRREKDERTVHDTLKKLDGLARANDLEILYSMHPGLQKSFQTAPSDLAHVQTTGPIPYPEFIWLLNNADLAFTDSGGIQEEGPHLGTPVIILREETERPEAVTDKQNRFFREMDKMAIRKLIRARKQVSQTFGDGKASERIIQALTDMLL